MVFSDPEWLEKFHPPTCPRCHSTDGFHTVEVEASGPDWWILITGGFISSLGNLRERGRYIECEHCRFVFRASKRFTKFDFAIIALLLGCVLFYFAHHREAPPKSAVPEEAVYEPATPTPVQPVNVNTATLDQITAIPYISRTIAQGIISHRPYVTYEDLLAVPGIKQRRLEQIRPSIKLSDD